MLVGLNPIYLVYAVGGFHNDFFMLVPLTASIAFLLARRDKSAGAMLVIAVAVNSARCCCCRSCWSRRVPRAARLQVLYGCALAGIPLLVMSLILFGFSIPNLSQQGSLLTPFSFPNLFGNFIGVGGGTSGVLRLADVALVVAVVLLLRRDGDWITRAGWATFALIASLAWVMPWYVIWLLPLAALALERAAAADGARTHGVPRARVPPVLEQVLQPRQHQPAERVGRPDVGVAAVEAGELQPRRDGVGPGKPVGPETGPHRRGEGQSRSRVRPTC